MKWILFFIIPLLTQCDWIRDYARTRWEERIESKTSQYTDVEKWKEKLAMTEAEMHELDEDIQSLVQKTREAGSLSWKIARGYMKASDFDLANRYYTRAIEEKSGLAAPKGAEVHSYEIAIQFFEKALLYKPLEEDLLYETSLAYANASRDRGWDPERRRLALEILEGLSRQSPEDSRYPFELALIYFDSSNSISQWEGVDNPGYDDTEKSFRILNSILRKEPNNVPARFAKANFLYRLRRTEEAYREYMAIRTRLESLSASGAIRESLGKNESYQNVLKNLEKIRKDHPELSQ